MIDNNKPVHVYRGGLLESTHDVHIAVVNNSGELLYSFGDPNRISFPRSALKPFQAIPLVESGAADTFKFSNADIAVCCASHSGEVRHLTQVSNILEQINLNASDLKCGAHVPRDLESYKQWVSEGKELTPIFNNCSGKHAGMLAACLKLDEDIRTYEEMSHPLQQRIIEVMFDICELEKESFASGIDGCSLPAHRFPLHKLALGFARLARPDLMKDSSYVKTLERIKESMMQHPEMVAGKDRFDTDLMNALKGSIVTKMGAEGIQGIGLVESGVGIAVKVEDGANRAASIAAMQVLEQLAVGNEAFYKEMRDYKNPDLVNAAGLKVGSISVDFTLKKEPKEGRLR